MRRVAALLVCVALFAHRAEAQVSYIQSGQQAQTSITWALGTATTCPGVGCATIDVRGFSIVVVDAAFSASPAFTGGYVTLETDDGTGVYTEVGGIPLVNQTTGYSPQYRVPVAGMQNFRARLSTTSAGVGTVVVKMAAATIDTSTRNRPHREFRVLTTANLTSGAVYNSPWFDTMLDGAATVVTTVAATTFGSAASGFLHQSTNDATQAGTGWVVNQTGATVTAGTASYLAYSTSARFYRVQYTNGGGTTGSFNITQSTTSQTYQPLDTLALPFVDAIQVTGPYYVSTVSTGKTLKINTGTLATSAATADQVVLTYTVTAGKTYYITSFDIEVRLTTWANTAAYFGDCSLESPASTKLYTTMIQGTGTTGPQVVSFSSEPIFIPASTVVRIVCTPTAVTAWTWRANIVGYER